MSSSVNGVNNESQILQTYSQAINAASNDNANVNTDPTDPESPYYDPTLVVGANAQATATDPSAPTPTGGQQEAQVESVKKRRHLHRGGGSGVEQLEQQRLQQEIQQQYEQQQLQVQTSSSLAKSGGK